LDQLVNPHNALLLPGEVPDFDTKLALRKRREDRSSALVWPRNPPAGRAFRTGAGAAPRPQQADVVRVKYDPLGLPPAWSPLELMSGYVLFLGAGGRAFLSNPTGTVCRYDSPQLGASRGPPRGGDQVADENDSGAVDRVTARILAWSSLLTALAGLLAAAKGCGL
jgi:hypothetical protein